MQHGVINLPTFFYTAVLWLTVWGTGIRGLMRGMAYLPYGKQELLVVKTKLENSQVSLQ